MVGSCFGVVNSNSNSIAMAIASAQRTQNTLTHSPTHNTTAITSTHSGVARRKFDEPIWVPVGRNSRLRLD